MVKILVPGGRWCYLRARRAQCAAPTPLGKARITSRTSLDLFIIMIYLFLEMDRIYQNLFFKLEAENFMDG